MSLKGGVQGWKGVTAKLTTKKATTATAFARGLIKTGFALQRFSQQIVPVDTGTLKNSATTTVKGAGFDIAVTVSYGTDYGIYVHENLFAKHKEGKYAKFLESPLRERQSELKQIFVNEANKG